MDKASLDDKLGGRFLTRLRGFQNTAENMEAVVFGEAADMIDQLLRGLGSAHAALINRDHADTAQGRAFLDQAAGDVAAALAYMRDAEAELPPFRGTEV